MGAYLRHPACFDHDTGAHPENAGRLRAIEAAMDEHDFLGLRVEEAPAATSEQLERVHLRSHVDAIRRLAERGGGMIDLDTVASERSFEAALRAAGGAVRATDLLLAEGESVAFCGLRPPGHHATASQAMGFCLFNNAAVAAAHGLAEHGLERVLVLDWDVHHGNGTNDLFATSDRVLYCSIHQSPCYPGTGPVTDTGRGAGDGYTLNLPVAPGAGSREFESLVAYVVVPVIDAWGPELVLISAGYDAHEADPLAECLVDTEAYGHMAAAIRAAAGRVGAPLLVCLEGGYEVDALAASVIATLAAACGEGEPRRADAEPAQGFRQRFSAHWPELAAPQR